MPKTKPPYPAEFRRQMVELAMAGRTPAELSREFDCSAQTIITWVARAAARQGRAEHGRARGAHALAPTGASTADGARHPGKGYGLVCRQSRQDVHTVFELMNANQDSYPVHTMCRTLNVSASGYCAWRHLAPSARAIGNAVLTERIRIVHAESDATYGMPRVRAELREQELAQNKALLPIGK